MAEYISVRIKPVAIAALRRRTGGFTTAELNKWKRNVKKKIARFADNLIEDEISSGV